MTWPWKASVGRGFAQRIRPAAALPASHTVSADWGNAVVRRARIQQARRSAPRRRVSIRTVVASICPGGRVPALRAGRSGCLISGPWANPESRRRVAATPPGSPPVSARPGRPCNDSTISVCSGGGSAVGLSSWYNKLLPLRSQRVIRQPRFFHTPKCCSESLRHSALGHCCSTMQSVRRPCSPRPCGGHSRGYSSPRLRRCRRP